MLYYIFKNLRTVTVNYKTIRRMKWNDFNCNVVRNSYSNGRIALQLFDSEDGMPVATATVNIPEYDLKEDQVLIKSWSENAGLADALVREGFIGPEISKVNAGHAYATLHKLLYL
jgi:hypothetical protein